MSKKQPSQNYQVTKAIKVLRELREAKIQSWVTIQASGISTKAKRKQKRKITEAVVSYSEAIERLKGDL